MKKFLFVFLLLCGFPLAAQTQKLQSQERVLSGEDFAFTLSTPSGWLRSDALGRNSGILTIFVRKSSPARRAKMKWKVSESTISVDIRRKENPASDTLTSVTEQIETKVRSERPDAAFMPLTELTTASGQAAIVKTVTGIGNGNREAIAYVDMRKTIALFEMSARTENDWKSALPAFEKLVQSCTLVPGETRKQSISKKPGK